MRKIAQRGQNGALRPRGRKQAAFGGATRFELHSSAGTIHTICRCGAVVFAQGSEAPIGIRDHMDATVAVHQNRQIAILGASSTGGGKNLFGMPEKRAHEMLIVRKCNGFSAKEFARRPKRFSMECLPLNKTSAQMHMIGVGAGELRWLKTLVWLLRHPDPSVPELARQALLYLTGAAEQRDIVPISGDEPHKASPNLVS